MAAKIIKSAGLALSLGLGSVGAEAQEQRKTTETSASKVVMPARLLTPDDTLDTLLSIPAFTGFASLILPWDGRDYDPSMPLRQIDSLLPYHSHVDPDSVVAGLNRMIADTGKGNRIFYDIWPEPERQADPSKRNTGLFFFRGKPSAPFAVIAPGGGFAYVGSVHEGFPYATAISDAGLNAFVIRYHTGQGRRAATEDLAAALSFVFSNAAALGVSTEGYSLWGSSAGARMAASIGSHGAAAFGGDRLPKPAAVIMAYTAHLDLSDDEPPTFVVVGEQDGIAPAETMARRVAALRAMGSMVEFHRYPGVGHGFGPGTGTSAEGWLLEAIAFWRKQMMRQ